MSTARVKQDAERADQMIRSMASGQESEQEVETPVPEPETETATEQEAVATDDQTVTDTGEDRGQNSDGTDGAQDTTQQSQQETDWEQKYRSLDGMLRQRDSKIDQLYEMIANMSMAQKQPSEQAAEEPAKQLVSSEDETAFGADLIDMVRRVAQDEFKTLRESFMQDLQGLKGQVANVETSVKQTAQERFESNMDKKSPKWRTLDTDPHFLQWLRESPVRYQQFAQAVQQLDDVAASELFNLYGQMHGQAQQQADTTRASRKQELEKQVAPGKSRKTAAPEQQADEPKTWTRSDIQRLYANKRSMDPQEFSRQEKDMFKAQASGRVDYTR